MKEFLTIGELANIFNMDVQLLRHYDAKGLLVPQVRNSENNRRFYHFDQVYPLATIRYLRRLDYSLAQIKAFLHSNGLRDNLQMLSQQAQQLRRQCDELNATIQIIQQKVEFIEREQAASQRDKFYVRSFPRRAFLHIGEEINLFTHELFYFYPTVGFYQGQRKWFGAYLYEDTPAEARRLPDLMADQPVSYIPAGDYLCGYHYGPYLTIQDSIDRLFDEARRRKLPVDDCVITPNIVDQCCEGHPDNYPLMNKMKKRPLRPFPSPRTCKLLRIPVGAGEPPVQTRYMPRVHRTIPPGHRIAVKEGWLMLSAALLLLSNSLFLTLHLSGNPGSFPRPLSRQEERECLEQWGRGDLSARNRLVEHNLRLVAHIIKKYYTQAANQEDLISIGTIGLIKAVNTFQPDKKIRLATYASRCIENEILMHFRAQRKLQGEVSLSEAIETDKAGNALYLQDVVGADDTMQEDLEGREDQRLIRRLVGECLTDREADVIRRRYGLDGHPPQTQRQVAAAYGISRSYVSRIEKRALEKLEAALREHCYP